MCRVVQDDKLYKIEKGPNKWDLITAFGSGSSAHTVELQYSAPDSRIKIAIRAVIMGLEHESGGGENFLFKGSAEMPNNRWQRVAGYYNTHSRSGHFKIAA